MTMFYQTQLFRTFARIIPYKMDNLQKKCMTINIYNQKFRKYLPLFRYSCKSDNEQLLFRKCEFTDNSCDNSRKLTEGEMTITSVRVFLENLNRNFSFDKWKQFINWNVYNIAGGSLLKCILTQSFNSCQKQDIDLFYSFTNQTVDETKQSNKLYFNKFINTMIENGYPVVYIENKYIFNNNVYTSYINFETVQHTTKLTKEQYIKHYNLSEESFEKEMNKHKWIKFQFISVYDLNERKFSQWKLNNHHLSEEERNDMIINQLDHDHIISNFDIDICQIRFDGNDVFCTLPFIFAVSSMSCISYKLSLREQLAANIDWCAFRRAIKYHYRGLQLYVPIEFDLDPLNSEVYLKWYEKYKNTYDPAIGYRSMRNFDFMNVLDDFEEVILNDYVTESVSDSFESNPDQLPPLTIYELSQKVLQYGIFDKRANCIVHVLDIDPPDIFTQIFDEANWFSWLFLRIVASDVIIKFETLQKNISDNKFFYTNKNWNLLAFASVLFVQCFFYPLTIRNMIKHINSKSFERFMVVFHWMFDYWFHVRNFRPSKKVGSLMKLSQFIFFRLTRIQAIYCSLLKSKHLMIYSQNKKYFQRYILDVLEFESKYHESVKENKYKLTTHNKSKLRIYSNEYNQIKPSFRILAIKMLSLYCNDIHKITIEKMERYRSFGDFFVNEPVWIEYPFPDYKKYDNDPIYKAEIDLQRQKEREYQYFRRDAMHGKYMINMNKRIDHNWNQMYGNVYCQYKKCDVNYYNHVYGMGYDMVYNLSRTVKIDEKLKINKWYVCRGCKLVYYCTRKCQKKDWMNHQNDCF
eukprot:391333_1